MEAEPMSVTSFVPFLARNQAYKSEKPYGADFPVDHIDGAKITNHEYHIKPIRVQDLRGRQDLLNLDTHGVCLIKAKTSLKAEEASISTTPEMEQYIKEVLAVLQHHFPEYVEIRHMDIQVRKRSPQFPHGHGQKVDFAQPATMPHTDFSVDGAFLRMKDLFPDKEDLYEGRDFDLLNIWKVLEGPNDDWPLAVCDYSSVDWELDTTTNDALHLQRTGENWLLHHSDSHRWYYLSGMEVDDLIVFRNTDSKGERSRCFHVAFENPQCKTAKPRQSVELRVAGFRN